jgi:hypothetical protein
VFELKYHFYITRPGAARIAGVAGTAGDAMPLLGIIGLAGAGAMTPSSPFWNRKPLSLDASGVTEIV